MHPTLIVECGWFGIGWRTGQVPEIRLLVLRLGFSRRSVIDVLSQNERALQAAQAALLGPHL